MMCIRIKGTICISDDILYYFFFIIFEMRNDDESYLRVKKLVMVTEKKTREIYTLPEDIRWVNALFSGLLGSCNVRVVIGV